jgi:hypothetical protein
MERPRTKGAKWTNKHIAPDEKIEDLQLETYEARRDRWNGYDAAEYSRVMDRCRYSHKILSCMPVSVDLVAHEQSFVHSLCKCIMATKTTLWEAVGGRSMWMHDRYEKVEEAKRAMRKKQALEKKFQKDSEQAGSGSDDDDVNDEDKIAEQEEAGEQTGWALIAFCGKKAACVQS